MRSIVLLFGLAACTKGAGIDDSEDVDTDRPDTDQVDTDDTDPVVEDWTVCDDGVAPFTDLQAAIDAASDGDTIRVCHGTYRGIEVFGRQLTIVGAGPLQTTIDGYGDAAVVVASSSLELSEVSLTSTGTWRSNEIGLIGTDSTIDLHDARVRGFVTDDDDNGSYSVVYLQNCRSTFTRVIASGNRLKAVLFDQAEGRSTIEHCVFEDNRAGIINSYSMHMEFTNNLIANNETVFTTGFHGTQSGFVHNNVWYSNRGSVNAGSGVVAVGEGMEFSGNILLDNAEGLRREGVSIGEVSYNIAFGTTTGANIEAAISGTDNLEVDPMFVDAPNGDFHLQSGSPAIDSGDPAPVLNDADGTRNDRGLYGGPGGGGSH